MMSNSSSLNLTVQSLKTFVPAKDYTIALEFYQAIGFELVWSNEQLSLMRCQNFSFLLQNFYEQTLAENFMMHLLVGYVDDWWQHLTHVSSQFSHPLQLTQPENRAWGMRDFTFVDPSGVLWRVASEL